MMIKLFNTKMFEVFFKSGGIAFAGFDFIAQH